MSKVLNDNYFKDDVNVILEKDICRGGRNHIFQSNDQKIWLERMASKGWTAPTWPTEFGGAGLCKEQAKVTTPLETTNIIYNHNTIKCL